MCVWTNDILQRTDMFLPPVLNASRMKKIFRTANSNYLWIYLFYYYDCWMDGLCAPSRYNVIMSIHHLSYCRSIIFSFLIPVEPSIDRCKPNIELNLCVCVPHTESQTCTRDVLRKYSNDNFFCFLLLSHQIDCWSLFCPMKFDDQRRFPHQNVTAWMQFRV